MSETLVLTAFDHHLIYILKTLLLEISINILVDIQKAIRSNLYMTLH